MKSELIESIGHMRGKRILVAGDMVADVYLNGRISRISREAPVLVLEQMEEKVIAGGATNVAHNAATLGGNVCAVGLLGDDSAGHGLAAILAAKKVRTDGLLHDETRSTVTKTRIIAGGLATVSQQIVRIDKETKAPMVAAVETEIMAYLANALPEADGVVLSDYGSGTLTDNIIRMILDHCRAAHIPCIVDSRYRILEFAGADYIKQNEAEVSAAVGFALENETQLLEAGALLLKKVQAKGVLVTRGAEGMTLFEASGAVHHIPVTNRSEVYDVSGAGDTCVAAMILALAAGAEPALAAEISNYASGIAVRKQGTATVSADELRCVIEERNYMAR